MEPITPKLTVDAVVITGEGVVLIKRKNPPFQGMWALPGGFVEVGETTEEACVREVEEETGLEVEIVKLLGVYSDPTRPTWAFGKRCICCQAGRGANFAPIPTPPKQGYFPTWQDRTWVRP